MIENISSKDFLKFNTGYGATNQKPINSNVILSLSYCYFFTKFKVFFKNFKSLFLNIVIKKSKLNLAKEKIIKFSVFSSLCV